MPQPDDPREQPPQAWRVILAYGRERAAGGGVDRHDGDLGLGQERKARVVFLDVGDKTPSIRWPSTSRRYRSSVAARDSPTWRISA
jgi:hypothetical protein